MPDDLTGDIPPDIGLLGALTELVLRDNNLTGNILVKWYQHTVSAVALAFIS